LDAGLAPVRGIDWQRALASAGGQPTRLHKRIAGFVQEYRSAPQAMRDALAGGRYQPLESLAHNLKSGAAYIGATPLAALAGSLEGELRGGRHERVPLLAPDLILALEGVLAGLARVALPPPPASAAILSASAAADGAAASDLRTLAAQLEAYLRDGDARADDALAALHAALSPAGQDATQTAALTALGEAMGDLEYDAALARLATLLHSLDLATETQA